MLAGLLALKDLTLSALQLVLCGGIDWTGFFSLDAGVMSSVCPGDIEVSRLGSPDRPGCYSVEDAVQQAGLLQSDMK